MYHSVIFGEKNTWDDWHLIPQSRPVFLPPDLKTSYIEVPGTDGTKDLSEALTGEIKYKNRQGSISFYVDNGHKPWEIVYSEIMNYLHGQQMKAYLEDDPGFYYEGRFSVNTWRSEKNRSEIVIDYNVAPYKIDFYSSAEDWLWDPFNLDTGIIRDYSNVRVDGELNVTMYGSRRTTIPTFITSLDDSNKPILLSWSELKDMNFSLTNGNNKFPDIKVKNDISTFTFKGKGVISIDYRGGSL
jgi:hypothetical protein